MRRGCLFGCSGVLLLTMLGCALLYFVALPRFQDNVRDSLSEELSTQVARQVDRQFSGARLQPGEYRLSLAELQERSGASENDQVDGFTVEGVGDEIVLRITVSGEGLEYRGVPEIVAGRLEMTGMASTSGTLDFFLPPDKLGQAIDEGVNSYIESQGMRLRDVHVEGSELVFDIGE